MANNENLQKASKEKNDEFYTQLVDIENELRHYRGEFKDKVVFCNCDDPYESNFFKYFAMNFNYLGLKKIIATCYVTSPVMCEQLSLFDIIDLQPSEAESKHPYKIEISEVSDMNGDGAIDLSDVDYLLKNKKNALTLLEGDGDFRSDECIKLMEQADIVVTNPPFSLFREFIALLMKYNKKFIVIGSKNAITYKEIFPLLKDDKMWLGYGFSNGNAYFSVPNKGKREYAEGVYDPSTGLVKFRNVGWFTNLDTTQRHEEMTLYKKYDTEEYLRYDNYNAININKTSDIPYDYDGIMGVPLTFLDKYNPAQFEIVGCTEAGNPLCHKFYTNMWQHMNGKSSYNMKSARYAPMILHTEVPDENYYTADATDGYLTKCYFRIFIKKRS